jgi:hypothetical protein
MNSDCISHLVQKFPWTTWHYRFYPKTLSQTRVVLTYAIDTVVKKHWVLGIYAMLLMTTSDIMKTWYQVIILRM